MLIYNFFFLASIKFFFNVNVSNKKKTQTCLTHSTCKEVGRRRGDDDLWGSGHLPGYRVLYGRAPSLFADCLYVSLLVLWSFDTEDEAAAVEVDGSVDVCVVDSCAAELLGVSVYHAAGHVIVVVEAE